MRLIDGDALRQEVERIFMKHFAKSKEKFVQDTFKALFKRIDSAPIIEARPVVRGRWVDLGRNYYTVVSQCSECGAKYDFRSPYCPNCGADMRGEEDG